MSLNLAQASVRRPVRRRGVPAFLAAVRAPALSPSPGEAQALNGLLAFHSARRGHVPADDWTPAQVCRAAWLTELASG